MMIKYSTSSPIVSIIVPVFNKEAYLEGCLESIIYQTYHNIEVLLIDDGSTDTSGAICDEWIEKDSRINVVHTNNKGVSAARNIGLKLAKGEFITFVDADDTLTHNAIEIMYQQITAGNSDVWISNFDKELWECCDGNFRKYLLNKRKVAVWGCIFRSDIAKKVRFPEELSNNEDFVYLYYISKITDNIRENNINYIYNYNQEVEQSLCKQVSMDRVNSTLRAIRYVEKITPNDLKADFELYAFNMYLYVLSNCPHQKAGSESLILSKRELGRYLRKHLVLWLKSPMRSSGIDIVKAACCSIFPFAYSTIVSAIKEASSKTTRAGNCRCTHGK